MNRSKLDTLESPDTSHDPRPDDPTTAGGQRLIYWGVVLYTALGLIGGLYYRELTDSHGFHGNTQLAVVHTHLLALGTLLGLTLMALNAACHVSRSRAWPWFVGTYHAGVLVTVGMLWYKGTLQVTQPQAADSHLLAGLAGSGHILLTVAFVLLLVAVRPGRRHAARQSRGD